MSALDDFSIFSEVVRANSFAGAARSLEMTASGVSRRISRFEARLGVRLFHRTTRSLSLTEAGQALAEQSEAILTSVGAAEAMVREYAQSPMGTLRVAASVAFSRIVIIPFLAEFYKSYPDLSVTLVQGDGGVDLFDERVDLAFDFRHPEETSFIVKSIIPDPWLICASPEYFRRHGKPKTPRDLIEHNCLTIHARGTTRDRWRFEEAGELKTLKVDSHFSGIGLTVRDAALQGIGVARLAHFLVCPDINRGLLEPALLEFMPPSDRHIYAIYPNRQHLPPKVRVFIDQFTAYVKKVLPVPEILARRAHVPT